MMLSNLKSSFITLTAVFANKLDLNQLLALLEVLRYSLVSIRSSFGGRASTWIMINNRLRFSTWKDEKKTIKEWEIWHKIDETPYYAAIHSAKNSSAAILDYSFIILSKGLL